MLNVDIRPLTTEDLPKLKALMTTRGDLEGDAAVEKRLELVKWVAFKNPFADGEPTYFVAHNNGNIVAHLGRMPMEFTIKGSCRKGYFVHDLFVHPEYRAKGLGLFITRSLYKKVEEESKSFCCLVWTTDLNLKLQQMRGYYQTWSDRYYKFLDPYPKLRKLIKSESVAKGLSSPLKRVFQVADFVLLNLPHRGIAVSKIQSFDSRFDNLNPQIIEKTGICPHKTSKYLNWRFLQLPFGNMEVFVANRNDAILGFAVVATTSKDGFSEGVLVDVTADPEDTQTITSLLRASTKHFKEKEVSSIRCCLTDKRFAKILKRFLFIRDFTKQDPVVLANLDKCEDKDYLQDINNWHLTCCASDELMLEPLDQLQQSLSNKESVTQKPLGTNSLLPHRLPKGDLL